MNTKNKIDKLRKRLHDSINENGLDSNKTRKISLELDKLINLYYENEKQYKEDNFMKAEYDKAYNRLKQVTKDFGEFPVVQAWNNFAIKNNYLSSESIKFISGLNWNKLRDRIMLEIK